MTDDERSDLVEIKVFLANALPLIERQLLEFPPDGLSKDYQFLINKAVMYREALKQINFQLATE